MGTRSKRFNQLTLAKWKRVHGYTCVSVFVYRELGQNTMSIGMSCTWSYNSNSSPPSLIGSNKQCLLIVWARSSRKMITLFMRSLLLYDCTAGRKRTYRFRSNANTTWIGSKCGVAKLVSKRFLDWGQMRINYTILIRSPTLTCPQFSSISHCTSTVRYVGSGGRGRTLAPGSVGPGTNMNFVSLANLGNCAISSANFWC